MTKKKPNIKRLAQVLEPGDYVYQSGHDTLVDIYIITHREIKDTKKHKKKNKRRNISRGRGSEHSE